MLANVLIVTLAISFIAIVAFGHVLLMGAIWTDRSAKREEAEPDTAADPGQHLPLPN